VKRKVRTVISEITKANWMKAHRKLRNECWDGDGKVDEKIWILMSNVGRSKMAIER
jgi:hypothetical protein